MNKDLTQGEPQSVLWKFSIPMFVSVIFQQLYNMADSVIAGKFAGEDALAAVFTGMPVIGEAAAALVGLIPNCASSVVITELYLDGIIGTGAMMSGLLVNAGVGVLVLFRLNRDWKQNAGIVAALYGLGVFWGVLIELLGIAF